MLAADNVPRRMRAAMVDALCMGKAGFEVVVLSRIVRRCEIAIGDKKDFHQFMRWPRTF